MSKVLYIRVADEIYSAIAELAKQEGRSNAKQAERILMMGLEAQALAEIAAQTALVRKAVGPKKGTA